MGHGQPIPRSKLARKQQLPGVNGQRQALIHFPGRNNSGQGKGPLDECVRWQRGLEGGWELGSLGAVLHGQSLQGLEQRSFPQSQDFGDFPQNPLISCEDWAPKGSKAPWSCKGMSRSIPPVGGQGSGLHRLVGSIFSGPRTWPGHHRLSLPAGLLAALCSTPLMCVFFLLAGFEKFPASGWG